MTVELDDLNPGDLVQFKCSCGGHGDVYWRDDGEPDGGGPGCGLISDGAVLKFIKVPGPSGTMDWGLFQLVMGFFEGDPDAPKGQFCPLEGGATSFRGHKESASYSNSHGYDRAVNVGRHNIVHVNVDEEA